MRLWIENLFKAIPGFLGARQVRGMSFVDFDTVKASTAAMMKFQGHRGLAIDYDKDKGVATKRKREQEQARR